MLRNGMLSQKLGKIIYLLRYTRIFVIKTIKWTPSADIIRIEKSNKMPQCIKILFHIYMKFNMFLATHRPSSGA